MRHKLRSFVALSLLFGLVCHTPLKASSNPQQEEEAKAAAKVKYALIEIGTGPKARVEIKLRDKTKLKGYVSDLDDDHFTLTEDRTGASVQVAYAQVQKVKSKRHFHLSDRGLAIVVLAGLFAAIGGQMIASHGDF
jgi:hypothetical protein